ncbi:ABC transporter ATP-binding protein [Bradyrhizobium sp. JR3.5]
MHAQPDASFVIERGEVVALMGSSGSGKSTLMSMLGCLDQPSGGQYFFEGVDVAKLSEPELARIRSQRIGFVFQSFNLLARTSAIENVALPPFYSDVAPSSGVERDERARNSLRLLNLGDREKNTPGQLSGGPQQRIAIARALINNPGLVLSDEPTGNLDTCTSYEIMDTLRTLNRKRGVTIVMVTHEPDIAKYADRVVTMRDGRIISDESRAAKILVLNTTPGEPPITPLRTGPAVSLHTALGFARMVSSAAIQALIRK